MRVKIFIYMVDIVGDRLYGFRVRRITYKNLENKSVQAARPRDYYKQEIVLELRKREGEGLKKAAGLGLQESRRVRAPRFNVENMLKTLWRREVEGQNSRGKKMKKI